MRLRGGKFGVVVVVALALVPTAAILPAGAATAFRHARQARRRPLNASARVTWVAPTNGGAPISATTSSRRSSVPPRRRSAPSTQKRWTRVITGLANKTTYTFKVKAQNMVGTGANSPASNAVTVGAPTAPAKPQVAPGNAAVRVNWVAPANNGSAVTGYVVTPFIGATAQAPRPFNNNPAVVQLISGLTNGTSYTFKVRGEERQRNRTDVGGVASPSSPPRNRRSRPS